MYCRAAQGKREALYCRHCRYCRAATGTVGTIGHLQAHKTQLWLCFLSEYSRNDTNLAPKIRKGHCGLVTCIKIKMDCDPGSINEHKGTPNSSLQQHCFQWQLMDTLATKSYDYKVSLQL